MSALRLLDLPPFWTIGAILLGGWLSTVAPVPAVEVWLSQPWLRGTGALLAFLSFAIAGWAATTMTRARTSVIPRRAPEALVTTGPFRFSRNPIYLADLGFLTAAGLYLGSVWPFLLLPALVWVLTTRFIEGEEAALRALYPDAFAAWAEKTGRWL